MGIVKALRVGRVIRHCLDPAAVGSAAVVISWGGPTGGWKVIVESWPPAETHVAVALPSWSRPFQGLCCAFCSGQLLGSHCQVDACR